MSTRAYRGEDPLQVSLLDTAKGERLRGNAREWAAANEGVWLWMQRKAADYAAAGKRFSIARLVEEARYTKPVKGVDEYRINNDIRAPLARMLIEAVPQCAGFIRTRGSVTDITEE